MHASEGSGDLEPHYQFIDIAHHGAFVLRFVVQRLVDGHLISQTRLLGRLIHHQSRRIDLSELLFHGQHLQVGDQVRLRIGAVGGVRRNGTAVLYAPNREAARFEVRGTTLAFAVRRV